MSWARLDDEAWFHRKFDELRQHGVDGLAAIGLWALALSFTGQKKSPNFGFHEAVMICHGDQDLAKRCFDLLRSKHLIDDVSCFEVVDQSLAKQTVIHDWRKYRSKDEARSLAGRKGGIKSGKSRQSKREANAKQNAKQTRSKPRTPDPDPDPDPERDINISLGASEAASAIDALHDLTAIDDNADLSLQQLEHFGFSRCGQLGGRQQAAARRLHPVKAWELRAALATEGNSWGYLLKVIESARTEAAKGQTPRAGPKQMRLSRGDQEIADAIKATEDYNARVRAQRGGS